MTEMPALKQDAIMHLEDYAMSMEAVKRQVKIIEDLMRQIMKKDVHFGTIPHTDKPTLLKPGAEKLCMAFRIRPKYDVNVNYLPDGHREYEYICHLESIVTGQYLGSGVGCCSTLESKYRYRTGPITPTGKPVLKDYWNLRKSNPDKAQDSIGGEGFAVKKLNGRWEIVERGERIENPDIADCYNTVKKIGKKRALVDAVLTVTAASDIFTQDFEDIFEEEEKIEEPEPKETGGNSSEPKSPEPKPQASDSAAAINEAQERMLNARMNNKGMDREEFKKHFGINHVSELPRAKMNEALQFIQEWERGERAAGGDDQ